MFTQVETSTLLAALRHYQSTVIDVGPVPEGLRDIATNGGTHPALGFEGVDSLCQRINSDPLRIAVVMKSGAVQFVQSELDSAIPLEVFTVDIDTEDAEPSSITQIDDGSGSYDKAVVARYKATSAPLVRLADVFSAAG